MVLSKKERLVGFAVQSAILLFIMGVFTYKYGFLRGGFESRTVFDQFVFYGTPGLVAFTIIALLFFAEYLLNDGDDKYGNSLGFYSPGDKPGLQLKILSQWKIILPAALLLFVIAGFLGVTEQRVFTGVGQLQQQFTPFDNILFSISLVSISENFQIGAAIAMVLFFLRVIARKNDWSAKNFAIIAVFLSFIAAGLVGVANHLIRYSSSDISLAIVFFFWGIGGLINVLLGIAYIFVIMHASNNGFFDARSAFSNDVVTGWTLGLIALLGVWLFLAIRSYRNRSALRIQ